jgi:hypothetical protein
MKKHLLVLLIMLVSMIGAALPAQAQGDDPQACPGAFESRLAVGVTGRALEAFVEVVYEPAPDGAEPQILPAGYLFTVLDGPVCEEDTAWWQIEYYEDGETAGTVVRQKGWIAEWSATAYSVEPLPELTQTYVAPDASITFMVPADYQLVADTRDVAIFSNSASGTFEAGSVMLAVYKSAYAVPSLTGSTGTPAELLAMDAAAGAEQGVTYGEPVAVLLGANPAAYTFTESPQIGMDSTVSIVGYGDSDAASMIMGMTAPGEAANGAAVVMAVGRSLQAADQDMLAATMTQPFALDTSFSINVPEGWIAEAFDDGATFAIVSREDVYNIETLDDLIAGQVLIFVYPTTATVENYPAGGGNEVPSTVVSFLASMGMITGYTAEGAMNTDLTAGSFAAASWQAHGANHDRLVITAENGAGDFVTFDAYGATGELFHMQPLLLAMLGTVSVQ